MLKKISMIMLIAVLAVMGYLFFFQYREAIIVIKSDDIYESNISIKQSFLDNEINLYENAQVKDDQQRIKQLPNGGESELILEINDSEKIIFGYIDVNQTVKKIVLNIVKKNEYLEVNYFVKTSFHSERGTVQFDVE
ncbi:hypothetical protein [Jeotgalibaca ciconiae]|uniref:Uncharacterized protein n=1 Tax=Jeotgalibaca ciconiae TaxID=2496265 RepID=A0A3S9H7N6_9LACT|nr:hypothetical protein [Jeotgalibaca ciconiae]AZP03356.1 hypothetical protein EJN90_00995 [Jeotgalibaca ciconiae]